ncbi:hypothetical protein V501_02487 [Pseudogymnoascus sp. VKM F-4519 (FW-2642)]|nr:hypothetical protein V501_02487 [Pseudogymnoascus sp. VKM F-4519 (FW-2642)]
MSKHTSTLTKIPSLVLGDASRLPVLKDATIWVDQGDSIKSAVHDMIQDAEDILWKNLMLGSRQEERFDVDLNATPDELLFASVRNSCATAEAQQNRVWMINRMLKDSRDDRLYDKKAKTWRTPQVHQYRKHQTRFLELLLVLFYMTSVPMICGEEITSLKFRGPKRNICLIDRRLGFIAHLQTASGKAKDVLQFLPWPVGRLLALYLAYIQRFSACLDPEAGTPFPGEYLWQHEARSWTMDSFTNVLSRESTIRMGFKWSTQEYRDITMSMGRKYFGAQFRGYLLHLDESLTGMNAEEINGLPQDCIGTLKSKSNELYKIIASQWHLILGLHSEKP